MAGRSTRIRSGRDGRMEIGGAEAILSAGESRLGPLASRLKPRLGPAAEAACARVSSLTGPSREFTRDSSGDDPFLEQVTPEPRVHPRLIGLRPNRARPAEIG